MLEPDPAGGARDARDDADEQVDVEGGGDVEGVPGAVDAGVDVEGVGVTDRGSGGELGREGGGEQAVGRNGLCARGEGVAGGSGAEGRAMSTASGDGAGTARAIVVSRGLVT